MKHKWLKRVGVGFICALSFLSLIGIGRAQDAVPTAEATLPPVVQTGTVPISDIEMYYATYGDPANTPLLLLHGGFSSSDEFFNQIPAFSDRYYVVTPDLRGQGRTTMSEQTLSYALEASDVLALMDYLKIDSADIVGWSDGAIIGLDIAIHHPERIQKLVAYGANYTVAGANLDGCTTAQCDQVINMLSSTYARVAPHPEGFEAALGKFFDLWKVEPNYTDEQLKSISVPTLILDGMQEELVFPEHTVKMARLIPTADLLLMSGIGHFAPLYKAEEFNRIILDYLAR